MLRSLVLVLVLVVAVPAGAARAQATENRLDLLPRVASSTATITPIYGQLLLFSMPRDFRPVDDSNVQGKYVQQSLPLGETLGRWTQRITITGERDAAAAAGMTPQKLAEGIAGFFRERCPTSFAVASFGPVKVDPYDGFATVISCGVVDAATPQSETLLLVTIRGERDYYTLQWTEIGAASSTAIPIDAARWQDRLARIAPVRLCPIVPGEAAPYPSCTQRR